VLGSPESRAALLRGVGQMTAVVRPTLGPLAHPVAIAGQFPRDTPEILDHAATILRRTIQIEDPFADMGAMLMRHLAWSTFRRAGDGAATAVTLAHALIKAAAVPLAAGADPNALRRGMMCGLSIAVAELHSQARPVDGADYLAGCIAGIVRDPAVAAMIGEVVDAVGPDGAVLVEDWERASVAVEYLDGVRWNGGLLSTYLLNSAETAGRLYEPCILITDRPLMTADDLLPVLEACVAAGERSLCIIAPEMGTAALGMLIANRERGIVDGALAVRAPGDDRERAAILEDVAVLTGGQAYLVAGGMHLPDIAASHLGRARQIWATKDRFGILGGHGDKGAIRGRIGTLKAELRAVAPDDEHARKRLRERISKLAGTAAVISVGAATDSARADLHLRVEAAVTAAQMALGGGAVPGGGAALMGCLAAVRHAATEATGDEALGMRLLAAALPAPMHAIVTNAGFDGDALIAGTYPSAEGMMYDVIERRWLDAWDARIIDPLPVVLAALEGSVSAAAMAITTDVLVRRSNPPRATEP
jgi:chaperonin GroEL